MSCGGFEFYCMTVGKSYDASKFGCKASGEFRVRMVPPTPASPPGPSSESREILVGGAESSEEEKALMQREFGAGRI